MNLSISASAGIFLAFAATAGVAHAEPVHLTLAFGSSDASSLYMAGIEPFVQMVNTEGEGIVEVEVISNWESGADPVEELRVVRDDPNSPMDIVFTATIYMGDQFQDHDVMSLPGLFRNLREASLVHQRLAAEGLLRGFKGLKVLGAYATSPEAIHTLVPVRSLADLAGKKIAVSAEAEGKVLASFGGVPVPYNIFMVSEGLAKHEIEGAFLPLGPLVEFGAARYATSHYMLGTSSAGLALIMSQAKYDSLPDDAKAVLDKASGEWLTEQYATITKAFEDDITAEFKANPARTYTEPSPEEMAQAEEVFAAVRAEWAARDPRNAEVLTLMEDELERIRAQ